MSKESTKAALDRYYAAQEKERIKELGPKRKYDRPEIELTQKPCKTWFRNNGWSMLILDASKSEWNEASQRWLPREDVYAGFSDSAGCTNDGTAAFVEFKAPGRRSQLKDHQREFLIDKINKGCFAVCVDGVECMAEAWQRFCQARKVSRDSAIRFLLSHLPVTRKPGRLESESLF